MPDSIVNNLVKEIQHLNDKYSTNFFEIEDQIRKTELQLSTMLDNLTGDEFDMKGIQALKSLLVGEYDEK